MRHIVANHQILYRSETEWSDYVKKIVIFNSCLERGGAERVTVYLADYFARNGIGCDIITLKTGNNEYEVPRNVNRYSLDRQGKHGLANIFALRSLLKKSSADVMLIMGTTNGIYALTACFGLKIKTIISERNDPQNPTGKKLVNKVAYSIMKYADGFVFQTKDAKKYFDKKLGNRGKVIMNPLVTDNIPEVWDGERKKVIVSAGRYAPQKNQKMLIDAFARISADYPEYNLDIYGEGALQSELQQQINAYGLSERIILRGNVSNLLEVIKDASLFVMTSDFEGMPNALIEGMALGLPCISTDCPIGGPKSLIVDGENGLLVPVGDTVALEFAMRRVLDNSQLAQKMGQAATNIRKMLDVKNIGIQWKQYFDKIIEGD